MTTVFCLLSIKTIKLKAVTEKSHFLNKKSNESFYIIRVKASGTFSIPFSVPTNQLMFRLDRINL